MREVIFDMSKGKLLGFESFLRVTKGKKICFMGDGIDYVIPESIDEDGTIIGKCYVIMEDKKEVLQKHHTYNASPHWFFVDEQGDV